MAGRVFGAIDIGASSGRVIAGVVDAAGRTTLHTVHRFPNGPVAREGHLRWDFTGLFDQVLTGLRRLAERFPQVESIGIDTWAVDYGLLDAKGRLLGEPVSYRDSRTGPAVDLLHARISPEKLYEANGLQHLPFTTTYQLEAERSGRLWHQVAHIVLLPDLLAYWLTGELCTEVTNASTTGLLDVHGDAWSSEVLEALQLDPARLPALEPPGTVRGRLLPGVASKVGLTGATVVTTVGSHDTASAVVAVPARDRSFAYVSSGTWSLAGLELDKPILTAPSRLANFTHERGVDDRYRFLRNIGGLWLLQESLRTWAGRGLHHDLATLLREAEALPAGGPVIDVDDPALIPPGDMPGRIRRAATQRDQRPPTSAAAVVRCIVDSLATAYAHTVELASSLADQPVDAIHIVGGGSQNRLLCQLTADLSGREVTAGPVEATALGNILVQARAHGAAPATLEELRSTLADAAEVRSFHPA
ncbi:rhamnulokinase [Pedococcus sp. 5OH_020]|uniref:rhamnulokinase n=1 Tax=Pedococcus sp. 5OH_020 TaxID=2989814 RepID=UPI0022E99977|nr:rhamnulokinase family protein [Pedococcus sp. 5OH_020]